EDHWNLSSLHHRHLSHPQSHQHCGGPHAPLTHTLHPAAFWQEVPKGLTAKLRNSFFHQAIRLLNTHYGRHDKTTCSDGRPTSQLQVVTCSSSKSDDVVASSCNGKNSCTIPATNSVFGDPCVGTYKYLEVVYTCQCKYLKQ
uniref:SUEL-type lectin domain-containing protein n=1 Tax=Oreochromis aureus TaxID=47969 RepID=A0AAZ1XPI2_OREAU